jgi:hypothetical protein
VALPRARPAVISALVLVVLTDAPLFIHRADAPPAAERRQDHGRDGLVARLDGVRDRWRLYDEFVLGERAGQRLGIRDLRGYPAVDPLTHARVIDVIEHARRDPAIVTDFNVRWVLQGAHFRYGTQTSFLPALAGHPAFTARGDQIFEARNPAPLIAWYGAATIVGDPKRVLAAVRATEQGGERRAVVLEPDALVAAPQAIALARAASVAGTLLAYAPDAIDVAIDAPAAGIAVLNELAFPGWTVEVDGHAAAPLRANYLSRAVWVDAGHHVVRWRFAPAGFRPLIAGYLIALAVMLAAAVAPRRRRAPAPAPP